MCDICGRPFCVGNCPAYSGDKADGGKLICVCGECNKKLYLADRIIRTARYPLCAECASVIKEDETVWQALIKL